VTSCAARESTGATAVAGSQLITDIQNEGRQEMAETKTQSSPETTQQQNQQQTGPQSGQMQPAGQGRSQRGLARRGAFAPSLFSLSPRDLFTASPFELMRRFSDEMDQAFENFGLWGQGRTQGGTTQMMWSPAIEVFQKEGNLVVRAELPGVNKDDVKVQVIDDGLVIQGERKEEHEEKGEGFYRSERSYGQFYRLVPLPDDINPDQVRADFNNGVLEITVPVPQAQQRRKEIPIGAGSQPQAASAKQT
jgi:HSP20 family protein